MEGKGGKEGRIERWWKEEKFPTMPKQQVSELHPASSAKRPTSLHPFRPHLHYRTATTTTPTTSIAGLLPRPLNLSLVISYTAYHDSSLAELGALGGVITGFEESNMSTKQAVS